MEPEVCHRSSRGCAPIVVGPRPPWNRSRFVHDSYYGERKTDYSQGHVFGSSACRDAPCDDCESSQQLFALEARLPATTLGRLPEASGYNHPISCPDISGRLGHLNLFPISAAAPFSPLDPPAVCLGEGCTDGGGRDSTTCIRTVHVFGIVLFHNLQEYLHKTHNLVACDHDSHRS